MRKQNAFLDPTIITLPYFLNIRTNSFRYYPKHSPTFFSVVYSNKRTLPYFLNRIHNPSFHSILSSKPYYHYPQTVIYLQLVLS